MANMYAAGARVDFGPVLPKSVEQIHPFEDGPNGRRPNMEKIALDEHGRPGHSVKADFPLGRNGADEPVEVSVWSHEVPEITYAEFHDKKIGIPVEFENLRIYVRASKTGKGVEVTMSADGMRTVGNGRPSGRRGGAAGQTENTEAA